jgi:prepilin-type N-terminal cleavage/methylation domain-containing protein
MKVLPITNRQGFSLVEFMVATVILTFGLLALINLQLTSIRGNSESKEMTRAIFLAEKKLEELKNTSYNSLIIGTTQDTNNPMNGLGQSGGIFSRSWTVQNYLVSNFMKQITVNVAWTLKGRSHNATFQTVVSR